MNIFNQDLINEAKKNNPLAESMRPKTLNDFIGQEHIVKKDSFIEKAVNNDSIFSMILWGPPGCGKTTLAKIIAEKTECRFFEISAVLSGIKDIKSIIVEAKEHLLLKRKRSILFVDEIHRFNKAQQDAFLHHVENGLITLIGATTENPSFEVIPPLLSRCRVIILKQLEKKNIKSLLFKALKDEENGLGKLDLVFNEDALDYIAQMADGDARFALNTLEIACKNRDSSNITVLELENIFQKKAFIYDKNGEEHYNIISAFHKSLRGSDPDAALYWLARMISSGEDPMYVARRMVRFASEDIGNADPNALTISLNAMESFRFLGFPEGELALAQAAAYLATAPKSNSIYAAWNNVKDLLKKTGSLPVPMHIRNAPTKLMKQTGYGKGYKYAHNFKDAYASQEYLPEKIKDKLFYFPMDRGYEKTIKMRLDKWRQLKKTCKKT
jgi:putative ATPase